MEDRKVLHIALVGGQPAPLYLAIEDSLAEKFILIHSDSTVAIARKLSADIVETMDLPVELMRFDPLDYFGAKEGFGKLLSTYADWRIEVNISGGTKLWSIAMAVLSNTYANVELLYVDQNSRINNFNTGKVRNAEPLEIADFLKYNQIVDPDSLQHTRFSDYTAEDLDLLPQIKGIRDRFIRAFNTLTNTDSSDSGRFANTKGFYRDPASGSEIKWDRKAQYVKLSFIGYGGATEEFELKSPHAFNLVTSSGWFEYEVATILKKWPSCKDMWLNVVFPYDNKRPKNEIDIIVSTGKKLLFVECKIQIKRNITDIDKFASAVNNYGGSGAKAIFITQQNMGKLAEEKCTTNSISNFSLKKHKSDSDMHKALFQLLDEMMQTSNAR